MYYSEIGEDEYKDKSAVSNGQTVDITRAKTEARSQGTGESQFGEPNWITKNNKNGITIIWVLGTKLHKGCTLRKKNESRNKNLWTRRKDMLKENSQNGRRYLPYMHTTKELFLEYINNSYNY